MIARADRIDLALDKALAERSLHEFFVQSWHVTTPGSKLCDGWHLEAIAEHLEAVVAGQIQDLLILVPPRCGKTLLTSSVFQRGRGFASQSCNSCAPPMGRISATTSRSIAEGSCARTGINSGGGLDGNSWVTRIGSEKCRTIVVAFVWRQALTDAAQDAAGRF